MEHLVIPSFIIPYMITSVIKVRSLLRGTGMISIYGSRNGLDISQLEI